MAKGHINSKTIYKGIRFPHDLAKKIDQGVEKAKKQDPSSSFTAWVLDACESKIALSNPKQDAD
nr:YlcI/YnfO family protein [Cedecea sp. NFIX57]